MRGAERYFRSPHQNSWRGNAPPQPPRLTRLCYAQPFCCFRNAVPTIPAWGRHFLACTYNVCGYGIATKFWLVISMRLEYANKKTVVFLCVNETGNVPGENLFTEVAYFVRRYQWMLWKPSSLSAWRNLFQHTRKLLLYSYPPVIYLTFDSILLSTDYVWLFGSLLCSGALTSTVV